MENQTTNLFNHEELTQPDTVNARRKKRNEAKRRSNAAVKKRRADVIVGFERQIQELTQALTERNNQPARKITETRSRQAPTETTQEFRTIINLLNQEIIDLKQRLRTAETAKTKSDNLATNAQKYKKQVKYHHQRELKIHDGFKVLPISKYVTQKGDSPGEGGANNEPYTTRDIGCTIAEFVGQHVEFQSLAAARETGNCYLIHLGGTHYLDCALNARLGVCKASKVNTPRGLFNKSTGVAATNNVGLRVNLNARRAWLVVTQALSSEAEHFFGYGNGYRIPDTEDSHQTVEYVDSDDEK
jgi:hypothetical protein